MENEIVQGDNGTIISLTIIDDNGNIVDLRYAESVELAIKFSAVATIIQGTVTDGLNGKVSVILNETDTLSEGIFSIQCTVKFSNGNKFSSDIQTLKINKNLRL